MKIDNLPETGLWFESLGIGMILLILGLMTRFVSLALAVVMLVAILVVHWPNGFSAAAMGIEIPLYYLLFFLILMSYGAGRFSLDRLFFDRGSAL